MARVALRDFKTQNQKFRKGDVVDADVDADERFIGSDAVVGSVLEAIEKPSRTTAFANF